MLLGQVGVVEQALEEVRRPRPAGEAVLGHHPQHASRVPGVEQVDRAPGDHRQQEPTEHPHGVADRRRDQQWRTVGR